MAVQAGGAWLVAVAIGVSATGAHAGQSWFGEAAAMPSGETISVEPFVGYLRGTSTEYVNNTANPKLRLSRLDWNVDAVTVGGRVAVRPIDGLTVRGRFWAAVAADAEMKDFDWFSGYAGAKSWTHRSEHPDTQVPKAWQADVSVAVNLIEAEDVTLTGIAGFRHYNVKYRANGGSFVYSEKAFRDTTGTFPAGQLGIAYEQWWDTPYIGLGAFYRADEISVGAEVIGSPFVMARDKDYHSLRSTLFKETYAPSGMMGAAVSAEYHLTSSVSLVGRLEYQRYFEAHGPTKMYDGATGTFRRFPKPAGGAEADALTVTAGVKARL